MKKYRIHFYRACGLIVLLCSVFSTLPCGAREFGEDEKLVFAHDVPWFRPEAYSLYTEWGYNYPVHDSSENLDKMTILLHEESLQATDLGIDGLFLDIGAAAGGAEAQWSWMLPVYLKAAEGTDLQVSFCLDVGSSGEYWGNEFVRLLKECGNHPNFPRYQGKYVIATYCYLDMSVDVWKEIYRITREAGYEIKEVYYTLALKDALKAIDIDPKKIEICKNNYGFYGAVETIYPSNPDESKAALIKIGEASLVEGFNTLEMAAYNSFGIVYFDLVFIGMPTL